MLSAVQPQDCLIYNQERAQLHWLWVIDRVAGETGTSIGIYTVISIYLFILKEV